MQSGHFFLRFSIRFNTIFDFGLVWFGFSWRFVSFQLHNLVTCYPHQKLSKCRQTNIKRNPNSLENSFEKFKKWKFGQWHCDYSVWVCHWNASHGWMRKMLENSTSDHWLNTINLCYCVYFECASKFSRAMRKIKFAFGWARFEYGLSYDMHSNIDRKFVQNEWIHICNLVYRMEEMRDYISFECLCIY